jgi:hypothetical protein
MYACGYHYYILILRNGEEIDSFAINLECNEIVTELGSRYFDLKKLEDFSTSLKHLYRSSSEFSSVTEARGAFRRFASAKGFVYARHPDWLNFEGEFNFRIKCPGASKSCYSESKSLINEAKEKIKVAYPGEVFELSESGGMIGELSVRMKCNKSLEEKFTIYDRWEKNFFGAWKPYRPFLMTYWDFPVETNSLLPR